MVLVRIIESWLTRMVRSNIVPYVRSLCYLVFILASCDRSPLDSTGKLDQSKPLKKLLNQSIALTWLPATSSLGIERSFEQKLKVEISIDTIPYPQQSIVVEHWHFSDLQALSIVRQHLTNVLPIAKQNKYILCEKVGYMYIAERSLAIDFYLFPKLCTVLEGVSEFPVAK
jgi:hypothetical protein